MCEECDYGLDLSPRAEVGTLTVTYNNEDKRPFTNVRIDSVEYDRKGFLVFEENDSYDADVYRVPNVAYYTVRLDSLDESVAEWERKLLGSFDRDEPPF